jgi:isocitrate dehydrogenase
MSKPVPVTVAFGDGIGPYITDATLQILQSAGANIELNEIQVGEKSYLSGNSSGISEDSWKTILKNPVFLKAPITTPQGSGYKSLNVTIRKALGLYANVRPCRAYSPFVETSFPEMNLTIIRENEEDLYAGVEYQVSPTTVSTLKLLTHAGSEKIIRYAFEYAVKNSRKKVTCMSKDNIMKIGDGMFHKIFNEIAKEYPHIETEHYIIDIGAARLAAKPQIFDVIVTLNLYGDIISDIVAEVSGSVGLAGSGNIGSRYSMFEAIHGSAPTMENKKAANPSGILNGAIMMLAHIGQGTVATRIQNAFLKTIEDGVATKDFHNSKSKFLLDTNGFAQAIIANLGNTPKAFKEQTFTDFEFNSEILNPLENFNVRPLKNQELVGVDIYISCNKPAHEFHAQVSKFVSGSLKFQMMSYRGMYFEPNSDFSTQTVDYWCCRFIAKNKVEQSEVIELINQVANQNLQITSMYSLYEYDKSRGFTLAQGQ